MLNTLRTILEFVLQTLLLILNIVVLLRKVFPKRHLPSFLKRWRNKFHAH